jgi:DNA-binding NtrC family response regulator
VLITDHNLPASPAWISSKIPWPFSGNDGVVITGFGTIETAVQAIKKGAYDYLTKPFKLVQLPLMVRKGLKERRLRFENHICAASCERSTPSETLLEAAGL